MNKPIFKKEDIYKGTLTPRCPRCENELNKIKKEKYCGKCGYRIDWR